MKQFARRGLAALALVFAGFVPLQASAAPDATEVLASDPRAVIPAIIDTQENRTTPVPHHYIHGTILDDAKFQILLPNNWNGKVVIHTRGFSGTEFSTGAFLPT